MFAVATVVTPARGSAGSDTGGAQFLLLLAGAVLSALCALRLRHAVTWPAFFGGTVVALGGPGLLVGSVSRGEEAESTLAGVVVGGGVGLLGWAFRSGTPGSGRRPDERRRSGRNVRCCARRASAAVGCRLSVGETALRTTLSMDEARSVLEGLATRGFRQRHQGPDGAVVYRFADFTRAE